VAVAFRALRRGGGAVPPPRREHSVHRNSTRAQYVSIALGSRSQQLGGAVDVSVVDSTLRQLGGVSSEASAGSASAWRARPRTNGSNRSTRSSTVARSDGTVRPGRDQLRRREAAAPGARAGHRSATLPCLPQRREARREALLSGLRRFPADRRFRVVPLGHESILIRTNRR